MAIRIAVNGFGRIGRLTTRILANNKAVEIVAINDLTDNRTLAHLFKYDSAHGQFNGTVTAGDEHITINGQAIKAFSERDPKKLPWKELNVDAVLESTGVFRTAETAGYHLEAGAKKVVISAPGSGDGIKTVVLGVNDQTITGTETVLSNASCTTNCLAPMVKVLDDALGIEHGLMTTIHAYTADQNIQDAPHKDLRRARAAALNIIPTSTGAAKAVGLVLPHLNGKLNGGAVRVPTVTGSLTEFNCIVKKTASKDAINDLFKAADAGSMQGILQYLEEPLVSSDIIGNPHSCIFDSDLTMVSENLVRVVGWYDNEAGYSNRLADLAVRVG